MQPIAPSIRQTIPGPWRKLPGLRICRSRGSTGSAARSAAQPAPAWIIDSFRSGRTAQNRDLPCS